MAGFVKGAKYNWKIELKGDVYAEMKCTAEKAFKTFAYLKNEHPDLKLYCNGKILG